jgi:hypothetical protein
VKRAHILPIALAPLLAACGAIIGAEWDGTLRSAEIEGSPGDDGGDTDGPVDDRDVLVPGDAGDAAPIAKTCGGDAKFCLCKANMPKEDGGVLCSVASIAGAADFCCANKNWPISGTCLCSEFKCGRSSPTFCSCGALVDGGLTKCTGSLCCYSPGFGGCSCYDTGSQTCPLAGDVEVAECAREEIKCGTDEARTEDCLKPQ